MKKCPNCKISFNTYQSLCPLCQNKLKGTSKECIFPKNKTRKNNFLFFKLLIFISIISSIIVSFIEYKTSKQIKYSVYVYISLITNYCITYFIIKNHKNILKMFLKYGVVLNILILIWYFITKTTIITNYIIPSICIFELLFNFILCLVLKEDYFINYFNLLLLNILLLIFPIILVLCNQTTNNIMSYICLIAAIISVVALLIFFYDNIKEEVKKIFNI